MSCSRCEKMRKKLKELKDKILDPLSKVAPDTESKKDRS